MAKVDENIINYESYKIIRDNAIEALAALQNDSVVESRIYIRRILNRASNRMVVISQSGM